MQKQANPSGFLSATVDEVRENLQVFGVFLAIMIPAGALSGFLSGGSPDGFGFGFGFLLTAHTMAQGPLSVIASLAAFIVEVVATYWLYSALVRRNISPDFGRILPFIGMYILTMIAIGLGLVALIVPGLILIVRWLIVLPLVVQGEKPAMDTLAESWRMTHGVGLSILGGLVLLVIASWIFAGVFTGAGLAAAGFGSVTGSVLTAIAENASTAVFAAFVVGAYRLLKDDTEELAKVFE